MKQITKFVTDDGKEFYNPDDARAHEDAATFGALIGLKEDDIAAALSRQNIQLADAFEKIGSRIAKKRLADGEKRRERRAKDATATTQEPATEMTPEEAKQFAEDLVGGVMNNSRARAALEGQDSENRTEGLPI